MSANLSPSSPAKKPRGRNGGRKVTVGATIRKTITLDQTTLETLLAISPNLSEAIRILAAQSKH
jgi:hypothetical protein